MGEFSNEEENRGARKNILEKLVKMGWSAKIIESITKRRKRNSLQGRRHEKET
jgi:hypothetical protein